MAWCGVIRRSACEACSVRGPPSPVTCKVSICIMGVRERKFTHHFERVELLLDLLCQDRSQPIASRDVATAVVVRGTPCIVELYARRKGDAFAASGCCRHAPGV